VKCLFRIKVIAVEPNHRSFHLLSTAVKLGGVSDRVHLISNAVSNVSGTIVEFGVDEMNRGHTYMCRLYPNTAECLRRAMTKNSSLGFKTTTITLLDLIAMGNKSTKKRKVIMKVCTQRHWSMSYRQKVSIEHK